MELIDYLQQMINWDIQAQKKFIYIRQDGILKLIMLNGKPYSIQDPQIDFDVLQMPLTALQQFKLNTYYYQNGLVIKERD